MSILTRFVNMKNVDSDVVHRVNIPQGQGRITACGVTLTEGKQIAHDVTCERCKDTNSFRRGNH